MCPACIVTVALLVGGATSTGGLTALVVKKHRVKTRAKDLAVTTQTNGEQKGSSKSGVTS